MVRRDHEPPGIRHRAPHLGESQVGGPEYRRYPLAVRVQCGAPGLRGDVFGIALAEPGLHVVTHSRSPAHGSGVGEEDHWAHHTIGEGSAVSVVIVGL